LDELHYCVGFGAGRGTGAAAVGGLDAGAAPLVDVGVTEAVTPDAVMHDLILS
jgi:hypothetical protein